MSGHPPRVRAAWAVLDWYWRHQDVRREKSSLDMVFEAAVWWCAGERELARVLWRGRRAP